MGLLPSPSSQILHDIFRVPETGDYRNQLIVQKDFLGDNVQVSETALLVHEVYSFDYLLEG